MIALAEPGRLTTKDPELLNIVADCGVFLPPATGGFGEGPAISNVLAVPLSLIVVGEDTFGDMDTPVVVPEAVRIGALPACDEVEDVLKVGEIGEVAG